MPKLGSVSEALSKNGERGPDYIEALARGLSVLGAFNEERLRMSLADLSKLLALPRATVRRSLLTLQALGFVETDEGRFWLTPKVLELAYSYLRSNAITTMFQPLCDRLAKEFGTGVSVAILQDDDVMFIVRAYPNHLFAGDRGSVGARLPAYCTALGRVLLAGLEASELAAYMKRLQPVQITAMTKTSKRQIRQEIDAARTNGFAVAVQEANIGYISAAAPIKRFDGLTVAALSINGRVELTPEKTLRSRFLPRLIEEAQSLSVPSSG